MSNPQQTILITGSNSGFGKLTALLFAEKGWKVAATMRSIEKAWDLADNPNIHVYPLDVTKPETIHATARACILDFGKIDVVVNNAGFGVYGACELATEAEIDRQFDVNVKGVIRVMKAFLPHFRANQDGMFINISSIAGLITYPLGSLYNSSKWALEGLTEGMFYELKPQGIRVKLVEPGGFATHFQDVGLVWTENESITAYDEMTERIRDFRAKKQATLPDPIAVAERVFEAATDPSDRLRYLVGEDAKQMAAWRNEIGGQAFMEEMYGKR